MNKKSVDVLHKVLGGDTALMAAAGEGQASCAVVVKTLLAAGADVNAQDGGGFTALGKAAVEGQAGTSQVLLAAGADVNKGINTPLDLASGDPPPGISPEGRAAVAQLLRDHGGRSQH